MTVTKPQSNGEPVESGTSSSVVTLSTADRGCRHGGGAGMGREMCVGWMDDNLRGTATIGGRGRSRDID